MELFKKRLSGGCDLCGVSRLLPVSYGCDTQLITGGVLIPSWRYFNNSQFLRPVATPLTAVSLSLSSSSPVRQCWMSTLVAFQFQPYFPYWRTVVFRLGYLQIVEPGLNWKRGFHSPTFTSTVKSIFFYLFVSHRPCQGWMCERKDLTSPSNKLIYLSISLL